MWYKNKQLIGEDPALAIMRHYFSMMFTQEEREERLREEWIIQEWLKGHVQIVSIKLDNTSYIS